MRRRVARLQPRDHHLDGDHRVVDEQAERDDQGAERDALQRDAEKLQGEKRHRQHQRDRQRDDESGAHAETDEADDENDHHRLEQRMGELVDGVLDDAGLVGDEVDADADRQLGGDLVQLASQRLAEVQHIGARLHADGEADGGLAIVAEQRGRRVDVAALDVDHVAEAEEAVVDAQIERFEAFLAGELAADPHADAFRAGLDDAGGRDGVLRLHRLQHRRHVQAEIGDPARVEFEVDRLVLRADEVDLADIRHGVHDVGAGGLDIVAQLPIRQAVGGERINVAIHVAELVVVERPRHALRQLWLDVRDQVADLAPDGRHVAAFRLAQQVDVNRGLPGGGVALRVVELFELLELLLDPVSDLVDRVADRRARP